MILIRLHFIFLYYNHILFIHCMLLSKEVLLITKITSQNAKNALQFFRKNSPAKGKSLATLGVFNAKWISNDNLKRCHKQLFFFKPRSVAEAPFLKQMNLWRNNINYVIRIQIISSLLKKVVIETSCCDSVVLEIYLDYKFQWPQESLNCESLACEVVT